MFHNKKEELKYIETNEQAKASLGKIQRGKYAIYQDMK